MAVDLETTGSSPAADAIIEIGAVRWRDGEADAFSTFVDPGRPVPREITRLTGIGDRDVLGAPDVATALAQLRRFTGGALMILHNAPFDLGFLQAAGWPADHPVLDSLELYRLLRPREHAHGLAAAARKLKLEFRHHRATEDARVTALLFEHLRGLLRDMDPSLLREIGLLAAALEGELAGLLVAAAAGAESAPAWRPHRVPRWPARAPDTCGAVSARAALQPDSPVVTGLALEQRPGQRDLLELVADALEGQEILVAEAPTGIGKSIAYLLPAMAQALNADERVVVSTGTKNLQEQLLHKDVPALLQATGWPVHAQLLKGRQNYLCLWRYAAEREQLQQSLPSDDHLQYIKLAIWLHETESGDRAELRVGQDMWSRIEATADTCIGERCPHYRDCYFFEQRRRAEQAHLVVVNHALLLEDAASGGMVLPEYDHLIVDEAHQLDAAAIDHLGGALSEREMRRLGGRLLGTNGPPLLGDARVEETTRSMQRAAQRAFAAARALAGGRRSQRLTDALRDGIQGADFGIALEHLRDALRACARALADAPPPASEAQQTEVTALAGRLGEAAETAGMLLEPAPDTVAWIDAESPRECALRAAPLYPGQLLRRLLYARVQSAALVSATLAVGDDFSFLLEALGLQDEPRLRVASLPSPFFFKDQCLLLVPTDLPEPRDPDFGAAARGLLEEALGIVRGRALVLFTAHRQLREFATALREPLAEIGVRLLAQGMDGPRSRLIEELRHDPSVVVFGAQSFWEGVDVVGDALRLVVLVKLPFQPPDRPVVEARFADLQARGDNAFARLSLPDAALRLKQGFGRLIRSSTDEGAVLVLDRRLATARYGRYLLEALPDPQAVTGERAEIVTALRRWLR